MYSFRIDRIMSMYGTYKLRVCIVLIYYDVIRGTLYIKLSTPLHLRLKYIIPH